jgi:DNA-binding transcriptional ArsR family regulator
MIETVRAGRQMSDARQLRHPAKADISLAGVMGALSDPVRLSIVAKLADRREHSWGDFDVGVAPSTLSHHMKVLREAGVINHRKAGTRCYLSLRPDLRHVFPGMLASILRCARVAGTSRSH